MSLRNLHKPSVNRGVITKPILPTGNLGIRGVQEKLKKQIPQEEESTRTIPATKVEPTIIVIPSKIIRLTSDKVIISTNEPSNPVVGDLWIRI